MEHNHRGLEDHFPLLSWVIYMFHVILPGCNSFADNDIPQFLASQIDVT